MVCAEAIATPAKSAAVPKSALFLIAWSPFVFSLFFLLSLLFLLLSSSAGLHWEPKSAEFVGSQYKRAGRGRCSDPEGARKYLLQRWLLQNPSPQRRLMQA